MTAWNKRAPSLPYKPQLKCKNRNDLEWLLWAGSAILNHDVNVDGKQKKSFENLCRMARVFNRILVFAIWPLSCGTHDMHWNTQGDFQKSHHLPLLIPVLLNICFLFVFRWRRDIMIFTVWLEGLCCIFQGVHFSPWRKMVPQERNSMDLNGNLPKGSNDDTWF